MEQEAAVPQGAEETTTTEVTETPDQSEEVKAQETPETPETPETEEQVEVATLSDFASYVKQLNEEADISEDTLLDLKFTKKVNGEEKQISLRDAVDNMSQGIAGEERLSQAKEKVRGLMEEATQTTQSAAANLKLSEKILEKAESQLDTDLSSIDLARLRRDDPAEYAAKKAEITERRDALKALKQEITDEISKAERTAQQQQQAQLAESLPEQYRQLISRHPEFGDEEKAPKVKERIIKSLSERGFSEQDIQVASYNAALVELAYEAMLYREGKEKIQTAKKKVLTIPKITKPGSQATAKPADDGPKDRASLLYG